MFLIGMDAATAELQIAQMAMHLPIGASLGHIVAITSAGILADDEYRNPTMYGYDADTDTTWRLACVDDEMSEHTSWRRGAEVCRRIIRGSADD